MPARDRRVDAYIAKAQPFARPILNRFRKAVHTGCPAVVETIKWGNPAFDTGAKQEETRERRLTTAIAQIAQGKHQNWKYQKQRPLSGGHRGGSMRRVMWTMVALVLGFSVTSCGGTAQAPASSAGTVQNPVSNALRSSWDDVKRDIKESAEQMPDENFAFKPTPDVRGFGDLLTHVAGASYEFCASAKNEAAPFQEKSFEGKMTTKADIVKVTNDAIAYCDQAFAQVTDANMGDAVHGAFGSKNQTTRASMLIGQIGHDNEHYGNLVTYFRLKNMVPPSSKRSGG